MKGNKMLWDRYTIVVFACLLHFLWAGAIIFDVAAINATALFTLNSMIGSPYYLAAILVIAGTLAAAGLGVKGFLSGLFFVPQQILLILSAFGSGSAMLLGHFADGVERSQAFIIADQGYIILVAIGHFISVLQHSYNQEKTIL